jgi:nanoRNase/pAp phosphatase (c-di-AMP/oligoRNAs hydrolase)
MREAGEKFGGEGGGHTVAAGARISPKYKKVFLDEIDGIIRRQMKK